MPVCMEAGLIERVAVQIHYLNGYLIAFDFKV